MFKYSATGDDTGDWLLEDISWGSDMDDSRFKYGLGDVVYVERTAGGSKEGCIAEVRWRRNGYPPPIFFNCWFPLYFLKHLDGSEGGGEIGENCLRLATEDDIRSMKARLALQRIKRYCEEQPDGQS